MEAEGVRSRQNKPSVDDTGPMQLGAATSFIEAAPQTYYDRLSVAEDQLQQLNETLEQRVIERTQELAGALSRLQRETEDRQSAEVALRQAQQIEALGKLTGGAAHDSNNPLQVIGGNLQLLSNDVAGDQAETRVHLGERFTSGPLRTPSAPQPSGSRRGAALQALSP